MDVSFFLGSEPQLGALEQLVPDRDFREFQTGERAWVLQTYLRLKQAGHRVALCNDWPTCGVLVFDSRERYVLRKLARSTNGVVLVGCRRDVGEALMADFEILQNGRYADGERRHFIPHWPQPGLIRREPARGDQIRRVVYKGYTHNLHPDFQSPAWREFLAQRGIEWSSDSARYLGPQHRAVNIDWNDFHDVDLVLAVRPPQGHLHIRKPATKLYNAWLAGVPALLGAEYAYRELKRSELDYMEVGSVQEAIQAVDRLVREPALYRAMVENGERRAREFMPAAILPRWVDLLYRVIPEHASRARVRRWQGRPLWLKTAARRVERLFTA